MLSLLDEAIYKHFNTFEVYFLRNQLFYLNKAVAAAMSVSFSSREDEKRKTEEGEENIENYAK